jgi:predicted lipoprotein
MTTTRGLVTVAIAAISLTTGFGCSDSATTSVAAPADRDAVAKDVVADVIVPAFADVAGTADSLAAAIEQTCRASASGASVDFVGTHDAWRALRSAWSVTRPMRFGPVMKLRLAPKIDYPADVDKLDALLEADTELTTTELSALGADQRGVSALEYVLFAVPTGTDDAVGSERRCAYAQAAIQVISAAADDALGAWQQFELDDTQMFLADTLNAMILATAEVTDRRLGPAAGRTKPEPQFAEVDAGAAQAALEDFAGVADGVARLSSVIAPLVTPISPDIADDLVSATQSWKSSIADVTPPLASGSDLDAVGVAYDQGTAVLTVLRAGVASALGVTLTLGDADGDS